MNRDMKGHYLATWVCRHRHIAAFGALLFSLGVVVGQQSRRLRFADYMQPAAISRMDWAILKANLEITQLYVEEKEPVATIQYQQECDCFLVSAIIPWPWKTLQFEELKSKLLVLVNRAHGAIKSQFDERYSGVAVPPGEFKMRFFMNDPVKPELKDFAEFSNNTLTFK
jgi:hypothetical protein